MSAATGQKPASELEEVQTQYEQLYNQLRGVAKNMSMAQDTKRRSELTLKEMQSLKEQTTTYRSVGRMFVKAPLHEVQSDLQKTIEDCNASTAKLDQRRTYLEKALNDVGERLSEIQGK